MKRERVVLALACLAMATICEPVLARPRGRISNWPDAVSAAKEYGRIILCMYTPGITRLYGPGKTNDNTAGEATEWPLISVICQPQVRKLQKQYYVIARLRMGDPNSNWDKFSSQTRNCCFVTDRGEFLEAVSTECTVAQFTEVCQRAVEKAKALRAADPPTPAEVVTAAEQALKDEDYGPALSKAEEALKAVEETSPLGRRADRVRKTIAGRAQGGLGRGEAKLEEGKTLAGLRELDEVAHLFSMLPEGKQAAQCVEAAMTDPKHAEDAAEYAKERKVYDLLEQGEELSDCQKWKEAVAAYQEIVDNYKASPVLRRAAARLKECRDALKEEEAENASTEN
ncbi:MAG: hypothetical protein JXL80_03685 [Planctomycetes bacterium]|nr:hypothetical protein [Planctomycetota bacterium]